MRTKETAIALTGTAASAASTTTPVAAVAGLDLRRAELLIIDALLVGCTGGTLDVYVQRKIATNSWLDWIHFPQIAAGTTKRYSLAINGEGSVIVETGGGTDAAPGVALAANTAVNVIPSGDVRLVLVTGGGVSVGNAQTVTITPYTVRN